MESLKLDKNSLPKSKLGKGCLGCFGLIVVLAVIGILAGGGDDNKTVSTNQSTTPAPVTQSEPAKQPEPVKTPDPIALSGAGQQASKKFTLTKGLSVFKMSHSGSANFAPILMDGDGNRVELLANDIGVFQGSKAVGIAREGEYLIDITASGKWTITIEQPRDTTAPATTSLTGQGQQATALFSLKKGLVTFKMTHEGQSNWAPILLDNNGSRVELLANEIGNFDGSKAVRISRDGIYLLDVTADGNWTFTIE